MVDFCLPQFNAPDAPERRIDVTSADAWVLMEVRPAGPDEPGVVCHKLYRREPATVTMAERLALLTPGRRVCSW